MRKEQADQDTEPMIARLLNRFHRAVITAVLVFAAVYIGLSLWHGISTRADADHLAAMMTESRSSQVDDQGATLGWSDLLRHGESLASGGLPLVARMEGKRVRMAGYMVPLDGAARRTTEFLLVPYYGACIHVPPPPSHQIVYARSLPAEGFPLELSKPVWIEGKFSLAAKESVYGPANYSMEVTSVEVFEPK